MTRFLKKLQSSDKATKRVWLIGATIFAMVIVLYVWLAYFNNLIVTFSAQHFSDQTNPSEERQASGSFLDHIQQGVARILQSFAGLMEYLGSIFKTRGEYIVNP